MRQSLRSQSTSGWLGSLAVVFVSLCVALLHAGWYRPLWIDEVGQLALGAIPVGDLLAFSYATTGPNINRGQTGIYNVIDWALLQVFGANAAAMRLPSLVSGIIALLLASYFMRLRGFSVIWQLLAVVMLGSTPAITPWFGQARVYAPLAAVALAIATYYQLPADRRATQAGRSVAVLAFPLGALIHPYWLVFVVLLSAYAIWLDKAERGRDLRSAVHSLPVKWLGASFALYIAVGAVTWMRGNGGEQGLWEQHGPLATVREFLWVHGGPYWVTRDVPPRILLFALACLAGSAITVFGLNSLRQLRPPILLLVIAAMSSLLIAASNIIGSYWIESRQWVGGGAIACVALTWAIAQTWRLGQAARGAGNRWGAGTLLLVSAAAVGGALLLGFNTAASAVNSWRNDIALWADYRNDYSPELVDRAPDSHEDFNRVATINVAVGGSVWPSVASFYSGYPGIPSTSNN